MKTKHKHKTTLKERRENLMAACADHYRKNVGMGGRKAAARRQAKKS